jgi:hypothetical protein
MFHPFRVRAKISRSKLKFWEGIWGKRERIAAEDDARRPKNLRAKS